MRIDTEKLDYLVEAAPKGHGARLIRKFRERVENANARGAALRACEIILPGKIMHRIGDGDPSFTVGLRDVRGLSALASFDELSVAEAYINCALDIEGDMYEALRYREILSDHRPMRYLWSTYFQPFLLGQTQRDEKWIKEHYDIDSDFFGLWLDKKLRSYSHGFFEDEDESLEVAMERKINYALQACAIVPGWRVLDIGGGWGSFVSFAGSRGVHVTSLTISKSSEEFISELIRRESLPCRVIRKHFLEYDPREYGEGLYDAIVNLGVTEHLPNYHQTIARYAAYLKPGRRVYLDAYSGERHGMPSFVSKWVFQGNTSPLNLKLYMKELALAPFEVVEVKLDRNNYRLTCEKWAKNLEEVREQVVARWGECLYRRFRMYLWAAASAFERNRLSAHRVVLQRTA
jgi:cyclopropane-fatty-acyl-phospholipid synthase